MPPKPRPKPAPKPTVKVEVEYAGEDWEVDVIIPYWATPKVKGQDPEVCGSDHAEWDLEMWKLQKQEQGLKMAEKALEKKRKALEAEEKVKNDKRLASLKASFQSFDEDGSGYLTKDEVLEILTRMTGGAEPLSEADALEFIKEFDRDGDEQLDMNEFICAMGVVSDAYDADGDGKADINQAQGGKYDGKEEHFAAALAKGEHLNVVGMEGGNVTKSVDDARKLQQG